MLMTDHPAIQCAETPAQIRACYFVMHQLRPHLLNEQAFIDQVQRQIAQGYHLTYLQEEQGVKALVGFRFLEFLAWGKVLYIDDLITDANARKSGSASKLLQWVITQAKHKGCDQVHLDSGPARHDAHRLYLNHGFHIIGHHFALDLKHADQSQR